MLQIVCSGPQSQLKKAAKALSGAGYTLVLDTVGEPDLYGHGHADDFTTIEGLPTPVKASVATAFLTALGKGPDRAVEVLEPLKWRLRSHSDAPELRKSLSIEDRLRLLGLTPADLRSVL